MTSPYQSSISYSPSVAGPDMAGTSRAIADLPQSQVDAIIRTKRKAREPKACYPCHARKVKCDRNLPCDGCVKRDHADLCSYERPSKKRIMTGSLPHSYSPTVPGETIIIPPEPPARPKPEASVNRPSLVGQVGPGRVSIAREEWDNVRTRLREMEQTISNLRVGLERAEDGHGSSLETGSIQSGDASSRSKAASPEREGIHAPNTFGEGTVHLGSRSVLAYILNNKSGSDQLQALLEGGILPKLGLDNESATYPFVDLWSSDMSTFDISAVCSALPTDQQCKDFFYYYRDIAGAIYPVLEDVPQFEMNLHLLLSNRASMGGVYRADADQSQKPFGVTIAYMGLLFAVLASGCQSSDLPGKERELTSQVYVCCSYQCLRMTNFLSQPTIDAMQTLLVIGNVLSYNMNPGISYVLLGMTLRMGLALGLHVESSRFSAAERYRRRHVWWSMAWQDSHFSLSYDRPSTTAVCQPEIAYRDDPKPGEISYFETLCRVIGLALEVVRSRMLSPHSQLSYKTIQGYKERIQQIMIEAKPHLRDRKYCLSATEHLERVVLKLHTSYFSSELYRPALKLTGETADPAAASMRADCVNNLMTTVEAYIEMHTVSSHASRSWIALQRAISSIFLLAVTEESKTIPRFWSLLQQLKVIISERANAELDFNSTDAAAPPTDGAAPPTLSTIARAPSTAAPSPAGLNSASPGSVGVGVDTQTQWAKPLTKTLRALEKLEAAFTTQAARAAGQAGSPAYLNPHAGSSMGVAGVAASMTPSLGSLPPPTPESSTSGEWSIPNILDRAAEYIHPPLWS
ncbi:cellobiose response regulator 2 [Aspergillus japonicus CBS 114.51]|uniref:Cellobiose response regulator 2 n=3 Tax=Aspergillus TaxID=5052 RepID=A0A2V5HW31_ASPV1|nr:cellobiose response regulator 2 [Aspergillus japonicus CBS 114.51]PYI16077.1 cellobiose response regulator 2 [Aspergillus violaceofuscus CBS 115571]RAH78130.1 cellobiose response regulator 2 [Aspergillus japonicus CBS 114.51]BAM36048.1 cellobiose response regulator 2 [Aspergillus aculeatus]